MRKTEISEKHIYCLEGNWNKNPRNSQSVKPILELLNTSVGVKYIYRKLKILRVNVGSFL